MAPISKRRRALYLVLCAALVVVGAPILIFYAEGYRLSDIGSALSVRETGGVYVAAGLSGVAVSVDGEEHDVTSFLSRGILVQNLGEGEYRVAAEKPGYYRLEKTLPVYPSLVTEWRPLLLPSPVPLREISEYVATGATTTGAKVVPLAKNPERATVAALFAPATSTPKSGATSTLVAADDDLAALLLASGRGSLATSTSLRRAGDLVAWIDHGTVRLAWLGEMDATPQYLCAPEGCQAEESVRLPSDALWLDFLPGRDDALVVVTADGAFAVEANGLGGRAVLPISAQAGIVARTEGKHLYLKLGKNLWEAEL